MNDVAGNIPSMTSARSERHNRGRRSDCADSRLTNASAAERHLVDRHGLGDADRRVRPEDQVHLVAAV